MSFNLFIIVIVIISVVCIGAPLVMYMSRCPACGSIFATKIINSIEHPPTHESTGLFRIDGKKSYRDGDLVRTNTRKCVIVQLKMDRVFI